MSGHKQFKPAPVAPKPHQERITGDSFDMADLMRGQESPARKLQSYLHDEWAGDIAVEDKWSARSSIAFVLVTCSLLWAGIWVLAQMVF